MWGHRALLDFARSRSESSTHALMGKVASVLLDTEMSPQSSNA